MEIKSRKLAVAALAFVLALPSLAVASDEVTGISISKSGNGAEVIVYGDALPKPKVRKSKDRKTYTLEFDADLIGPVENSNLEVGGLKSMITKRVGEGKKLRIRLEYVAAVYPKITSRDGGWAIKTGAAPKGLPKVDSIVGSQEIPVTGVKTVSLAQPVLTKPVVLSNKPVPGMMWVEGQPTPFATIDAVRSNAIASTYKSGNKFASNGNPRVSLDFVNTDVVLILKALAMQTKVNVVTSPKVIGKVSVKIDDLPVNDALNLITSLSGLRYAEIRGSYIVTTKEDFLETLKMVGGPKEEPSETRVVPIYSGEGNQIKASVIKTVAQDSSFGRFELLLPSEKVSVQQKTAVGGDPKAGDPAAAGGDSGQGTSLSMASQENAKDSYVVLIGTQGRIDEIEAIVKRLDKQICSALGMKIPSTTTPITRTYLVKGGRASDLVTALAGNARPDGHASVGTVELYSTPNNSISKQTVVLKGREDEVGQVLMSLEQLDSSDLATQTDFVSIELQYSDPRAVRELLIASVPGISVTIPPASVGNPRLFTENKLRSQADQRGTGASAPQLNGSAMGGELSQNGANGQSGAQGAAQGTQSNLNQKTSKSDDTGTVLPYDDFETVGFPMKLILRGSRDQIERSTTLIKAVDTAPKQVALELRVMELSKEDLLRVGLDWNLLTGGAVKFIKLGTANSPSSGTVGVGIEGRSLSGDVTATLDSQTNKNKLISKPNLLAMDGRESEIFVGDVIRYVESILSSQNGPSVTTGTLRVGVRLSVLPRVGANGTITLDLRPVVSFLKGWEAVPQIGGRLPQTSERIAQSTVTMMSGETIAIGGLIQEQDRVALQGLPILKDLPIVGQFFRKTSVDKVKTDLVLFLTTRVVDGPVGGTSNPLPMGAKTENKFETPSQKSGKGGKQ